MGSQRVRYNWETHTLNIGWEVFFLWSLPSPPKESPSLSLVMFLGTTVCFSPAVSPAPGEGVAVCSRHPKYHFGGCFGRGRVSFWSHLVILATINGRSQGLWWTKAVLALRVLLYHMVSLLNSAAATSVSAEFCAHLLNDCVVPSPPPLRPLLPCSPCSRRGLPECYLCLFQLGQVCSCLQTWLQPPVKSFQGHGEFQSWLQGLGFTKGVWEAGKLAGLCLGSKAYLLWLPVHSPTASSGLQLLPLVVSYPPGLAVVVFCLYFCSFLIIWHEPGVGFCREDTEVLQKCLRT